MKRLQAMTVPEMKAECKNLNIQNYSKMKKSDLIETITRALESNGYDPKIFMFQVASNGNQADERPVVSKSNNQVKGPGRSIAAKMIEGGTEADARKRLRDDEGRPLQNPLAPPPGLARTDGGRKLGTMTGAGPSKQNDPNNDGQHLVDNKAGKKQKMAHEKSSQVTVSKNSGQEDVWVVTREEGSWSWGHSNSETQIEGVYSSQKLAIQAVMRKCKGRNSEVSDLWEMRHELEGFINNSKNPFEVDRTGVIVSISDAEGSSFTFGVKKIKKNTPMVNSSYGSDDEGRGRGLWDSRRDDEATDSDDSDYSELEWLVGDKNNTHMADTSSEGYKPLHCPALADLDEYLSENDEDYDYVPNFNTDRILGTSWISSSSDEDD